MIPNISSNCNNAVFDVFAITSESLTLTDNWVSGFIYISVEHMDYAI
jgi:hypothetical protein